jgi:hypothetical protein
MQKNKLLFFMKKIICSMVLAIYSFANIYAQTCSYTDASWLVYNIAGTPTTTNWETTNNTNFISASPSTVDDTVGSNIPGQVTYHSASNRYPGITGDNLIWNNSLGNAANLVFKKTITASDCDSIIIRVSADDKVDNVWVNGTNVFAGSSGVWTDIDVISIPDSLVNDGNNYICIQASDGGRHATWLLAEVCVIDRSCCDDACFWTLDGNHIAGNRNIFGTLNNNDIRLYTNSIQRGLFTKTGSFGWNTTTPTAKMHVDVTGLTSTTGIRFQGLLPASDASVLTIDASGNIHTRSFPPTGIMSTCFTFNKVPRVVNAAGDLGCGQIYDDGIYVGINMNAPAANLDITNRACDNNPALKITNDENGACTMGFSNGDFIDCKAYLFGGGTAQRFVVQSGGQVGVNRVPSTYIAGTGVWTAGTPSSQMVRLDVAGLTRSVSYVATSDAKYKSNITQLNNALENVMKLRGVEYNWNSTKYPDRQFDDLKHSGFIAQELLEVLPNAVIKDKEGDYAVDYNSIIPVLAEAIKEQQKRIEQLEAQIQSISNKAPTRVSDNSSETDGAYLAQNIPNPFSANTEIKYQLPKGTRKASINIYDMNGKELRLFRLTNETGSVNIQAGDLHSGMYLYALIIDGKVFDTKKMVLTAQ